MPTPTYTDTTLSNLVISKISQAKFDELKNAGLLNEDELYIVENETLDAMGNVVKNVGTPVQNTDAANKAYVDGKTQVATSSTAGIVKPDGTTITVDANGVISSSGGSGGGGITGYTVTFANDFESKDMNSGSYLPASMPFYMVSADGTTTTVDLINDTALRGTSYQNIVYVYAGNWTRGDYGLRPLFDHHASSQYTIGASQISPYARGVIMESNGTKCGIIAFVSSDQLDYASYEWDYLAPPWDAGYLTSMSILVLAGDTTVKSAHSNVPCLLKGTLIRLANGQDKPIEEITYDDELLVWDFDNGKFASAKPLWIKTPQASTYYFKNVLASGKTLLTTGQSKTGWGHRMFDFSKQTFKYTTETVSDRIFTLDGIDFHKSCERIEDECEHYNIITEKHFNLFANGILTSCSYNNIYPIRDMKFVKDARRPRPFEAYDVPLKYYEAMRLSEQQIDPAEVNEYVKNLIDTEIERNEN